MIAFLSVIDDNDTREYFQKIYYEHHSDMFACAMSMLKNQYDAEDAVQHVLLKIWTYAENVRKISPEKIKGYLVKSVYNHCCTVLKKESSKKEVCLDIGSDYIFAANFDVEEMVWDRQRYDILMKALDELNVQYRQIILDKTILDLTDEQAAEHIGIKPTYARECLHRARQALYKSYYRLLSGNTEKI